MMRELTRSSRAFRPARRANANAEKGTALENNARRRVLIVDLNNFATFPTLTVGVLVAALRQEGHEVQVLCPLSHDVPAAERERQENWFDHFKQRIHLTESPWLKVPRNLGRRVREGWMERSHPIVLREVERALERGPDIVLLSAYFQHFNSVKEIGERALRRRIPVLLGGAMFNNDEAAGVWRTIPGLAAVVGAESDLTISALVEAVCNGENLTRFAGLTLPNGQKTSPAPPLRQLDEAPIPDFTDFPWDRYRVRIVPVITGRGCQWDRCHFCSDVFTVNGRTFRTRSIENVLLEMQEQARRHGTTSFLFHDLKLNSYPDMIRGIASKLQSYVNGAEWIGTVHVDLRKDNGLSRKDLFAAVSGGMRRINFGLESGSQALLDRMDKGTSVAGNSEFIRDAFEAGLSIRCSMFKGYPGETADDMEKTASFLESHSPYLDRIRFSDFSLLADTPIYKIINGKESEITGFKVTKKLKFQARSNYIYNRTDQSAYATALTKVLRIVHDINRRPIRSAARQFDGVM
jgi:anaerobic magnesium-protoporphyrin IX monomethyl ester cyclase